MCRKSTLIQHVTPVHVLSRIHTVESGKAGNERAWSHSKNKSVMSEKRESGKAGNVRAWSHSKNKSVMSEKKEKHYNASIHIYVQLISVM